MADSVAVTIDAFPMAGDSLNPLGTWYGEGQTDPA